MSLIIIKTTVKLGWRASGPTLYILRSLTSLHYMVHVCRGGLTSPLIHCILCLCGLGS